MDKNHEQLRATLSEQRRANDRINELGRERDEMRKERDHAQEELADKQAADETIEILTKESDKARAEIKRFQGETRRANEYCDALRRECGDMRQARDAAKALLKSAGVTVRTQLEQIKDLTKERDEARAEVKLFQNGASASETTYATYARVVDGETVRLDTETDVTSGEETAVEQVHTLTSRVIDAIERRTKCQGVDPEQVSIRGYFVQGNLQWMVSTMGWSATAPASLEQAFDNLIQLILEGWK